jgi:hypothetical protein
MLGNVRKNAPAKYQHLALGWSIENPSSVLGARVGDTFDALIRRPNGSEFIVHFPASY